MATFTRDFSGYTAGNDLTAAAPADWQYVSGDGLGVFGVEADGTSVGPLFSSGVVNVYRFIGGSVGASQFVEMLVEGLSGSAFAPNLCLMARMSTDNGASNDRYELQLFDNNASGSTHVMRLVEVIDNTPTVLAEFEPTVSNGDTIRLEVIDNVSSLDLVARINGTIVRTETDVTPLTGLGTGLGGRNGTGKIATWSTGDYSAATPPSVTVQPSSASVTAPATANFGAVTISGTYTGLQWQRNPGGNTSFASVSGGTGATTNDYTTGATAVSGGSHNNGDTYRLAIAWSGGTVFSNVVTLTVNAPSGAVLSNPQVFNVGDTTATASFDTDAFSGTAYFRPRIGGSAASAATIISEGQSQAIAGSNPQQRALTGLTTGQTYYVDMAQSGSSAVVTAGPFYPGTGRPVSDITVTGWTGSAGGALASLIDEDTASEIDFITSPTLSSTPEVAKFALDKTFTPGTYPVHVRANVSSGTGQLRVRFFNGSDVEQGVSNTVAINSVPTTHVLSVTLTGNATRAQIEVLT